MAEKTLIIIKPDGIQRHLAGEIISRFEKKGFKLIAAKFLRITEDLARQLYAVHRDKPFYEGLVKYICCSPALITVWQAEGAIETARKMIGATLARQAEAGSIRGDFSCSTRCNLVHGSDSGESARREIELFFKPEEIFEYELSDGPWLNNRYD